MRTLTRTSSSTDSSNGSRCSRRARDLPARQRTLRATIEWSHELLDPRRAAALGSPAVFAGGFTLEVAERVCEADLDAIESLVDKNLVRRRGDRFTMLETIRELARERLGPAEDSPAGAMPSSSPS